MLVKTEDGRLMIVKTGYPYPDTVKQNYNMLQDLFMGELSIPCSIGWIRDRYSAFRSYAMSCVDKGVYTIDVRELYLKMQETSLDSVLKTVDEDDGKCKIYYINKESSNIYMLLVKNIRYSDSKDILLRTLNKFGIRSFPESDAPLLILSSDLRIMEKVTDSLYGTVQDSLTTYLASILVKSDKVRDEVDKIIRGSTCLSLDAMFLICNCIDEDSTFRSNEIFSLDMTGLEKLNDTMVEYYIRIQVSGVLQERLLPLVNKFASSKYNMDLYGFLLYSLPRRKGIFSGVVTDEVVRLLHSTSQLKHYQATLIVLKDYGIENVENNKYIADWFKIYAEFFSQSLETPKLENEHVLVFNLPSSIDVNIKECYEKVSILSRTLDRRLGMKPTYIDNMRIEYDLSKYFDIDISGIIGHFIFWRLGLRLNTSETKLLHKNRVDSLIDSMLGDNAAKLAVFDAQNFNVFKKDIKDFLFSPHSNTSYMSLLKPYSKKFGTPDLLGRLLICNASNFVQDLSKPYTVGDYSLSLKFRYTKISYSYEMHISEDEFEKLRPILLIYYIKYLVVNRHVFLNGIDYIDSDKVVINFDKTNQTVSATYEV